MLELIQSSHHELRKFIELAKEIKLRINANREDWARAIQGMTFQLNEIGRRLADCEYCFLVLHDAQITSDAGESLAAIDPNLASKSNGIWVIHSPSLLSFPHRELRADTLESFILLAVDPYKTKSLSVRLIETLHGPFGGFAKSSKHFLDADQGAELLDQWIRWAESRLNEPVVTNGEEQREANETNETTMQKLLSAYTQNTSNEKLQQMVAVIDNPGTVEQKTTKLHQLISLNNLSGESIGKLLGCTKQAVFDTTYWQENRAGKHDEAKRSRRMNHKKRAGELQHDFDDE